jgi:hypothetical protein
VVLELEGADRVGDALEGVAEAVGEVVHGVDHPGLVELRIRALVFRRVWKFLPSSQLDFRFQDAATHAGFS